MPSAVGVMPPAPGVMPRGGPVMPRALFVMPGRAGVMPARDGVMPRRTRRASSGRGVDRPGLTEGVIHEIARPVPRARRVGGLWAAAARVAPVRPGSLACGEFLQDLALPVRQADGEAFELGGQSPRPQIVEARAQER